MRELIEKSFFEAEDMLRHFMSNQRTLDSMEAAANLIIGAFNEGAKLLVCGNGGSMCDAMHFAEEWSGRFRSDRPPYAAIALSDPAHMSCVANDYGFEQVFSRQVEALGGKGDVLFILSTSGNSPNIVKAAEAAKEKGVSVVGFLGKGGGQVREFCDVIVHAPGETSDRIQELHMLALHILIQAVEAELGHG
jgi:D-sedoheptulose 7-phosphate isomerase